MKVCACGLMLAMVVAVAGCGGGGGGQIASASRVPSAAVGTYRVQGLGLPDDQMSVQSGGDVVVSTEAPAGRADSVAKIGTCGAQGALLLNGSWRLDGVDYEIAASGMVLPESHSLTLQATVTGSNAEVCRDETFSGDWISDLEFPPPPPGDPPDDDMELPPPPPGY